MTKQVNEDQTSTYGDKNDAEFGETVNYKTTVVIGAHQKNVVLEDRLYNGLKLCPASGITVKVNDVALDPANYTLTRNSDTSFTIVFDTAYTEALAADTTVVVEYSAEVLTTAVLDVPATAAVTNGNDNETWVTYGDDQESTHDWTRTYVWTFPILKYTEGDTQYAAQSTYADATEAAAAGFVQNTAADATTETYWMKTPKNPLADAHFSLYRAADQTNAVQFVQVSAGSASAPAVYRLATAAEIADSNVTKVTDLVTPASGEITIQGVDSEQFVLKETAAPAGYNKLADDITVEIVAIESAANQGDTINGAQASVVTKTLKQNNATVNQVEVLNNTGAELPATGGVGTWIGYIVGAYLLAFAYILLRRRRKYE